MPLSDRMRKCFICDIWYYSEYQYINELVPEQWANKEDGNALLFIPPFVMLHMMFALNHHRLGDTVSSQQSLQDLHSLMLYNDRILVPTIYEDISWQILGILQQTIGDFQGALNSFTRSLVLRRDIDSLNYTKKAAIIRILTVCGRLLQKY